MNELKNKLKELRVQRTRCSYWIDNCTRDLEQDNCSSYESYMGCKIVLKENQKVYCELDEKIEILEKALAILEVE